MRKRVRFCAARDERVKIRKRDRMLRRVIVIGSGLLKRRESVIR